jgi:hypothetical protein
MYQELNLDLQELDLDLFEIDLNLQIAHSDLHSLDSVCGKIDLKIKMTHLGFDEIDLKHGLEHIDIETGRFDFDMTHLKMVIDRSCGCIQRTNLTASNSDFHGNPPEYVRGFPDDVPHRSKYQLKSQEAQPMERNKEKIMARFPSRESDVAALASQMITGLTEEAETFSAPPRAPADLEASLEAYKSAQEAAVVARSAAAEAKDIKDDALDRLIDDMRAVLRYAEDTVNGDGAKLQALGWSGRSDPAAPRAPGQARALEVKREGPGWVYLDWKKPVDGGVVAAYHIQVLRDGEDENKWRDVTICFDTMAVLTDQERGVQLKYRVVTVNRVGEGLPSNTVTATL